MSESPSLDAETVFAQWAELAEADAAPAFEDVLAAHPLHVEELRQMHGDWLRFAPILKRVVPGSIEGAPGLELPGSGASTADSAHGVSPELLQRLELELPDAGRYRFRGVLGRGGGGVVLRVWDQKLHRPLAMKVVLGRGEDEPTGDTPRVDAAMITRFVDEARIASQLDHPGIVPVHELSTDATGRAFFTMRLVKGEDLSKIFARVREGSGEWTEVRALGVLAKVCEAVAYANEKGVVHRDLKPANVMVGRHGDVQVMDWGLARVIGSSPPSAEPRTAAMASQVDSLRRRERLDTPSSPLLTQQGSIVGTPAYMAPEQARGDLARVGAASDVYAIGAMLYELLAGAPPFVPRGARVAPEIVLMRVIEGPPRPLAQIAPRAAPELVAICERAMARELKSRYLDVRELERDLRAFLEGRVVAAYETGTWAETRKWVRRNKLLAGALVAFLLSAAIGTTVSLHHRARAEDRASAADEATKRAEAARVEARWENYVAQIRTADQARRMYDVHAMRRALNAAPEEHRAIEWYCLDALSDTSEWSTAAHEGSIRKLVVHPKGELMLSVGEDGTAKLWSVEDGSPRGVLRGHTHAIVDARFAPSGEHIVTASEDGTVRTWLTTSGEEFQRFAIPSGAPPILASFTNAAQHVCIVAADGSVHLGELGSLVPLRCLLELDGEPLRAASFDSHGALLAIATGERTIRVLDTATGALIRELSVPHVLTAPLHFSPDAKLLAVAEASDSSSDPEQVVVVELATGQVLLDRPGALWEMAHPFCSESRRVVLGGLYSGLWQDLPVEVFDVRSGEVVARAHVPWQAVHTAGYVVASLLPNDLRLLVVPPHGRPWISLRDFSADNTVLHLGCQAPIAAVAHTPDGTASISGDESGGLRKWRMAGRSRVMDWQAREKTEVQFIWSTDLSPDGMRVLYASSENLVHVIDVATRREIGLLARDGDALLCACFAGTTGEVLATFRSGCIKAWNGEGKLLFEHLPSQVGPFPFARLCEERGAVILASPAGEVMEWSPRTRELKRLPGPDAGIILGIGTDARHLACGTADGKRWVQSLETGVRIAERQVPSDHEVFPSLSDPIGWAQRTRSIGIAWSPDGESVAVGGEEHWELRHAGRSISQVADPAYDHHVLGFATRDARWVVGEMFLMTFEFLDARTGEALLMLGGEETGLAIQPSAIFSRSGSGLILSRFHGYYARGLWPIRRAERRRIEAEAHAAMKTASTWVDAARQRGADWPSIAATATAEFTEDPVQLRAVRNELLRRQSGVEGRHALLEALRRRFHLAAAIETLEADSALAAEDRADALRFARASKDTSADIYERTRVLYGRWRETKTEELRDATRALGIGIELDPENLDLHELLAFALIRAGRSAEGLEQLARARPKDGTLPAEHVAYRALAQHGLGRSEEARASLAELRKLEVAKDLLTEVIERVEGSLPPSPGK